MNYLAHALLAEPHRYSLIGNIAGDLVKGPLESRSLHPLVIDGIRRHRRVDALTDTHPRHQQLRALFPGSHRRVGGIVLDVLFDYFLYRNWARFSSWPEGLFREGVYAVLREDPAPMPEELATVAPHWVAGDWLRVYETLDGVQSVLQRMERRSKRVLPLREAFVAVLDCRELLEAGFIEIFSDVQSALDGLRPAASAGLRE